MEIIEVGAEEYSRFLEEPFFIFGTSVFNQLNIERCDELCYLLFKDGKYRFGIIGGIVKEEFKTPFSAPFGGFSYISSQIRISYLEAAIKVLIRWAEERNLKAIRISLPPTIYEPGFIAKQINCLWREEFKISTIDLNYSFNLENLHDGYIKSIWRNARKNLNISLEADLSLYKCDTEEEKRTVYDIISKNRQSRGFPLRMSWELVSDTAQIIPADFFLVKKSHDIPVASAIVFHVAKNIVQVIYWGDLKEYSNFRTMNFLSFRIFEHYKELGFQIVDLGPSSENSVPNYGLAEFKESIGCTIQPKYSFHKSL